MGGILALLAAGGYTAYQAAIFGISADDPDSMTEKPAAFRGRQSDFVKETLFGKGCLLTVLGFSSRIP